MKGNDSRPTFGIPPDGEPSETLLSKIKSYSDRGIPLAYIARMNRLPLGYIVYIKAKYLR